jgi:hypothetical protein
MALVNERTGRLYLSKTVQFIVRMAGIEKKELPGPRSATHGATLVGLKGLPGVLNRLAETLLPGPAGFFDAHPSRIALLPQG